jgi:hypothetical protein
MNIAQRFMTYSETFYKKRALDRVIPKLEVMSYFLLDKNGQIFMKQWLNNKK